MSPTPQTSFLVGTYFAASYSKPALAQYLEIWKKISQISQLYYCCYCSYWREIIHSVALISLPEAYGMIREWPSLEGHNPNSTIIIIIILVQPAQSGLVAWAAIVELCGTVVTTHFIRSNNDKLLRDSSAARSLKGQ